MGFLTNIKSVFHKTAASALLKKVISSHDRRGLSLKVDFAKLASDLIECTWREKPEIYDGAAGVRPHKITIVAMSLVYGIALYQESTDSEHIEKKDIFLLSLGTVFTELAKNAHLYPLTALDHDMLAVAMKIYAKVTEEVLESPLGKEIDAFNYKDWDSWYRDFVKKSSELNNQILIDEDGMSLIDLMDHEPLKKAYCDGVSPEDVARMFAPSFDIRTFGR
ncbi:hypothetical protein [Aeromonas schubertii]|uniref:hypothetical protein n=1 Tax=Aeromonas schubertii TaxID=652 RepID=UPI001CC48A11|nr:hypothetical protein [Aeromonas schubertii]MBZ6071845.1 hypothetical protein [Aeromonas schubertii]